MNLLNLLFPKTCLECGKLDKYICDNCLKKATVLNRYHPKIQSFSIFAYAGVIKQAIAKIKYKFAYDIAEELSNVSYIFFKNPFGKDVVLVPIPLYESRENWRGFNQSEIIGKLLAQKLGWQFNKDILYRKSAGKTQVGLKGRQRVRNIRGKFAVNPEAKLDQNITYIVFDDVLTTGSTISEAIKVLKKQGVERVFGLCIAS